MHCKVKSLKVNTRKTKVMVSRSEKKLFKSKICPCGVSERRVMANLVLCTKCGNWVHGRWGKIELTLGWQHVLFAQEVVQ